MRNAVIATFLSCLFPFVGQAGWAYEILNSTYLGGSERNYYGNRLPSKLNVIWKVDLGTGFTRIGQNKKLWKGAGWTSQPLLVQDGGELRLSIGANDHHLRQIRASDGKVIWKTKFDDVLKGTGTLFQNPNAKLPMFEDSLIIIQGSRYGVEANFSDPIIPSLRGISWKTGRELWRMNCRKTRTYSRDVDGSALVIGDRAYLALENSMFTIFSPDPGLLRKRNGILQPRIYREIQYYEDSDLKTHGGNIECESSPTLLGDRIYTASGAGRVYGYNTKWKNAGWKFEVGSDLNATMPVTNDGCLLLAVEKQFIPGPGGVFKIDPSQSSSKCVKWFFPTENVEKDSFYEWEGGIIGSVAVNDRYVKETSAKPMATFIGVDGFLYLISTTELKSGEGAESTGPDGKTKYSTPKLLDKIHLGDGSIATPIFVGNKIAAPYDDGLKLFEVNEARKLNLLDEFVGSQFEATPVCHDGRMYVASLDGNLYCFGD